VVPALIKTGLSRSLAATAVLAFLIACAGFAAGNSDDASAAERIASMHAALASMFRLELQTYGGGQVTIDPGGVACGYGSRCSETYAEGTSITLNANVGGGSVFTGWNMSACPDISPVCTLTMDSDKFLLVHFGTAWSSTTTSISSTTTTTLAGSSIPLFAGWNLVGTGAGGTVPVASTFSDPAKFASVWKWVSAKSNWAFFSPIADDGGASFAAGNGFDYLTTVNPGEGFWVNAKADNVLTLGTGSPVPSSSFQETLGKGWNLIAIGDHRMPSAFNAALSLTPPSPGIVVTSVNSLWSWDASAARWRFYTPHSLTLQQHESYCLNLYRCFQDGEKIGPGDGFWVNKP